MEMNILLVIFAVLALWRIWRGAKRGITEEIHHLMTMVIALFVVCVGILLYTSVKEQNGKNIAVSVAVIIVTGLVTKVVRLIMKSLEAIAHLPGISVLDTLLGIAAGAAEVIVLFWIMYTVIDRVDMAGAGDCILQWTGESSLLQTICNLNVIPELVDKLQKI